MTIELTPAIPPLGMFNRDGIDRILALQDWERFARVRADDLVLLILLGSWGDQDSPRCIIRFGMYRG